MSALSLIPPEFSDDNIATKAMLEAKVLQMLRENSAMLMNVLYRIDISEIKLSKAFETKIDTLIAAEITDLIIDRLEQKLEMRKKYG